MYNKTNDMVNTKQEKAKRRTPGNPFGQTDTNKFNVVESVKLDAESAEAKLLIAAMQAGMNKSDLIRRCLKHLPSVIEEAQSELGKLLKLS